MFPPERIVCLTEETVETLYLLGEEHRIVGISGYVVRPPRARREKPRVSAFTSADIPKILDLEPDLVLTFSDLQADIAAALIRQGVDVHAFNQRTIAEILNSVRSIHLGQYLQDARAVDSHRSVFGPIVFPGCSTSLQPARRSASALHSARASLALWQ